MRNSLLHPARHAMLTLFFAAVSFFSFAQYCDSIVPSFSVDLSASPNMNWVSPPIVRDGNCCGTTNPDKCLEFIIILHPSAIAVSFNIASGAIPPGALFYQIDCGPITPVGSPICLNGAGPHHLTFCKPGNNENTFSITSYSNPVIGPDITLNAACQGFIYGNYYNEASINWTSIAPGATGAYDGLLSCTSGCDTTYITAPANAPAFVDYLVCGMDVGGCNPAPICDTIRVNFIPPVVVDVSATTTSLCSGQTTTITASASGGSGGYVYVWNTGSTASSVVVPGGTYYVDVTDTSGCFVATDTIVIQQFVDPPVTAGLDQSACAGSAVTLTGSGANSYVWDNGVTNGIPFGQPVGTVTYTVIGLDTNGCSATDQVNVTINALPVVGAGADQEICEGDFVTLNGSGANSYIWDNSITNGQPFQPGLGTTTYNVIGTDLNGCSNTDQVIVVTNPLPVVSAGMDQVVCEGVLVTLNGSGAQNYTWSGGVVNNTPFLPAIGTAQYSVIGVNTYGCIDSDDVLITVNPNPMVNGGADISICEGESVTLNATDAVSYSWSGSVVNNMPFTPAVGQYQYVVVGTDANGCIDTDTVNVTVNPNPVVNAGPDVEGCDGDMVTLNAQGSPNLVWNNGVINGLPFAPPVGVTTCTVYDTLATGCSGMDQLTITIYPNPVVTASDVDICPGEGAVLIGSGALNYSWSGGIQNGNVFYPSFTQNYVVIGTDGNGCSSTDTVSVTVHDVPNIYFDWDNHDLSMTTPGTNFINLSTGATLYEWEFGDNSPNSYEFEPYHEFPDAEGGGYFVTLTGTNEFGCVADYTQYLEVEQDFSIFVPNAFTPDNNGINEIFLPVLFGFDEDDFTLYIFNRWGQLVFESHDMSYGWDGTLKGDADQVQDGVYSWKIVALVSNSYDRKVFTGHVSLLK